MSVILKLEDGGRGGAGLEALVDEVAELSAWCACVGIPMLSIYEKTGTSDHSEVLDRTNEKQVFSRATSQQPIERSLENYLRTLGPSNQLCRYEPLTYRPWNQPPAPPQARPPDQTSPFSSFQLKTDETP